MKYAFDTLVEVQFKHSYFSDTVFNGFNINVSNNTLTTLNKMGLLFKAFTGGFYILYDKNFGNTPRTRDNVLNENITFEFTLTLKDPNFYTYTANLPDQISDSMYYFHNSLAAVAGAPNANTLHADEFVSEKDVHKLWYFKEKFFTKPFAKLDLTVNPGLEPQYYISFMARATYWRYILMSDYLQNLNSPAIIASDNTNVFGTPLEINLPDDRTVCGFVSADKLTLSQRYGGKTFQLVENYETGSSKYKVVMRALASPDINYISRIPLKDTNPVNYSDIFIY
jgi:hypothetical protein